MNSANPSAAEKTRFQTSSAGDPRDNGTANMGAASPRQRSTHKPISGQWLPVAFMHARGEPPETASRPDRLIARIANPRTKGRDAVNQRDQRTTPSHQQAGPRRAINRENKKASFSISRHKRIGHENPGQGDRKPARTGALAVRHSRRPPRSESPSPRRPEHRQARSMQILHSPKRHKDHHLCKNCIGPRSAERPPSMPN